MPRIQKRNKAGAEVITVAAVDAIARYLGVSPEEESCVYAKCGSTH